MKHKTGQEREGRKLLRESERVSEYGEGVAAILASAGVRQLGARARLQLERINREVRG